MALQYWEFRPQAPFGDDTPLTRNVITIASGTNTATTNDYIIIVKDIIGTPSALGYTNIRFKCFKTDFNSSYISGTILSNAVGVLHTGVNTIPYTNGMTGTIRIDYSAINVPINTNSTGIFINCQIIGTDIGGIDQIIENSIFEILFFFKSANAPFFNIYLPRQYHYFNSQPTLNKTINFHGLQNDFFEIDSSIIHIACSSQVATLTINGSVKRLTIIGSGIRVIPFTISLIPGGIAAVQPNNVRLEVFNFNGNPNDYYLLAIEVLNQVFTVTVDEIVGFSSIVSQLVDIFSTGTVTYTSVLGWTYNFYTQNGITTFVINSLANQAVNQGYYSDLIRVYDNGIQVVIINVNYTLSDWIAALPSGFSLDPSVFKLKTTNTNTYFQFDTTFIVYEFNSALAVPAFKSYFIPQKLIPFNGECEINANKPIHRLFDRFVEPNDIYYQYNPAEVTLLVKEISFNTGLILRQATSNTYIITAGLFNNGNQIFNFNSKPSRATVNSVIKLNFRVFSNQVNLLTFKNGQLISFDNQIAPYFDYVVCLVKNFLNYNPGDMIMFQTQDLDGNVLGSKTYCIFPEGKHSNIVTWENEYLLQTALEFTGNYNIGSEFEFLTHKGYANLVEYLEILETTKETKLTINTGWILQTDVDDIESLMRSKRAWIGPNNINLRPIGKKMTNQDSERELIEFTIEFLINRKTNEETYSL